MGMMDSAGSDDLTEAVAFEAACQGRLEALLRGEIDEEQFIAAVGAHGPDARDTAWSVLAYLDQRHRLGQVPAELLRSLDAKITRDALSPDDTALTVDLTPTTRSVGPNGLPTVAAGVNNALRGPHVAIGTLLGNRYTIVRRAGDGGMGAVYQALDLKRREHGALEQHIAIKVLHEQTQERPEILARLRREFYCAQGLSHRSVVRVFDIDRDGHLDFFTMEWLEGTPLSELLRRAQPQGLPRAQAWRIVSEIAAGLGHAHARNVVHGDLKPQNVMVLDGGEVRILDFGAASDAVRPLPNFTALTPAYASCELLAGEPPDARDDIYALACLTYEMLTGHHPFEQRRATEARDLHLEPQRPAGLSASQWLALKQGLAWQRTARPASVRAWIESVTSHERQPSGWAVWQPLLPAALGVLVVAVGLAVFRQQSGVQAPLSSLPAGWVSAAANTEVLPLRDVSAAEAVVPAPPPLSGEPQSGNEAPTRESAPPPRPRAAGASHDIISVAAIRYLIRPGQKFAEIHVRRSSAHGGASFAWWTEPGTAEPGVDYVQQPKTSGFFAPGSRLASVFVRILNGNDVAPKPARTFFVHIGDAGSGAAVNGAISTVSLAALR